MNTLILLSGIVGLIAYFPLWVKIPAGKVKQNLVTWILWLVLDVIILIAVLVQRGNSFLLAAYTLGTVITVVVIFRSQGSARWTWFDSMIVVLVIGCMVIWYLSDSKIATIAATLAALCAGIPQLIDAWRRPQEMSLLTTLFYLTANSLSAAGAKDWSVEQRFHPVACAFYSLTTVLFILRRYVK